MLPTCQPFAGPPFSSRVNRMGWTWYSNDSLTPAEDCGECPKPVIAPNQSTDEWLLLAFTKNCRERPIDPAAHSFVTGSPLAWKILVFKLAKSESATALPCSP